MELSHIDHFLPWVVNLPEQMLLSQANNFIKSVSNLSIFAYTEPQQSSPEK